MAGEQLEWVFDSLVEFLRGPIWNIPVLTFIEQKSVVFEPGAENEEELTKIHEAYKNLVDFMLGSYMEDLRITPDEFEKSCSVATKKALNQFHQNLFQQVWAADDFEIFKRMMTQKNLELQLQALEFLTQKRGSVPNCMEPNNDMKDDERAMEEIIKKAIGDICEEESADNGTNHSISADVALQEKMELEALKEKELLEQAIQHSVKEKDPDVDIAEEPSNPEQTADDNLVEADDDAEKEEIPNGIEKDDEEPDLENEPEPDPSVEDPPQTENDAVEDPPDSSLTPDADVEVQSTLSELPKLSLHGSLPPIEQPKNIAKTSPIFMMAEEKPWLEGESTPYEEQSHVEVTPMDMEKRQNYLRQQRDRILAMKKQERSRRLSDADDSITQARPKSARAAKKVLREESTEVDPNTLAFRKTLAAKLRSEVIDRND